MRSGRKGRGREGKGRNVGLSDDKSRHTHSGTQWSTMEHNAARMGHNGRQQIAVHGVHRSVSISGKE